MVRRHISACIWAAFAGAFLLFGSSPLYALEIVAVKSSAIRPYNDAVDGLKNACNCSVKELNLAEKGERGIQEIISIMKPDAILAVGRDALLSVLSVDTFPVFYIMVTGLDPGSEASAKGLVGLSMDIQPETFLSYTARLIPKARKIGLLYNQRNTGPYVKKAIASCRSKGLEVIALEISGPGEVAGAVKKLRGNIDVFWMLPDISVMTSETVEAILLFSFQNKVPVLSFSSKYVKMGALASLSIDPFDLGVQSAELITSKLSGDLTEKSLRLKPQKVLLSVNRKIAEKLGITLDSEVLRKAAEVY